MDRKTDTPSGGKGVRGSVKLRGGERTESSTTLRVMEGFVR